jgi:hypothetical protein
MSSTSRASAGGFAAARQQRAAERDQPVGILFGIGAVAAAKQRAAALGDGGEQVGEEGVRHLGLSKPVVRCGKFTRDLGGSRSQSCRESGKSSRAVRLTNGVMPWRTQAIPCESLGHFSAHRVMAGLVRPSTIF